MTWPAHTKDHVLALIRSTPLSASQIARMAGVSRNAVIGFAYREGGGIGAMRSEDQVSHIGLRRVIATVEAVFEVSRQEMYSSSRTRRVFNARATVMHLGVELLRMTRADLGAEFDRDGSTVYAARKMLSARLDFDPVLRAKFETVRHKLAGTKPVEPEPAKPVVYTNIRPIEKTPEHQCRMPGCTNTRAYPYKRCAGCKAEAMRPNKRAGMRSVTGGW